jgi:hypothetical protein
MKGFAKAFVFYVIIGNAGHFVSMQSWPTLRQCYLFAQIANCETTDQVSSCFSSQNGADLGRVYTNDPGLNVCLVPSPAPTPEAEQ